MAINNIEPPNIINVNWSLRLIKYNGNYEIALRGYQDPYAYQNSKEQEPHPIETKEDIEAAFDRMIENDDYFRF